MDPRRIFSDVNSRGDCGFTGPRGGLVNQDATESGEPLGGGESMGPSMSELKNGQCLSRSVMKMTEDTYLGKGKRKSSSGGTAGAAPRPKIAARSSWWTSATETGGTTVAVTEDGIGGGLTADPPLVARGHCPCPRR